MILDLMPQKLQFADWTLVQVAGKHTQIVQHD